MLLKALTRNIFSYTRRSGHLTKKPPVTFRNWQILTGDIVQVRTGGDRGKVAKVLKVHRKTNMVTVQGANMYEKVFRDENENLVKKQVQGKMHVSNVGLYDQVAKRAVRIKYGYHPETLQKLRISKKTGVIIPKPKRADVTREARGKNKKKSLKDTSTELAHRVTYEGEDFEQIKRQFETFIAEKQRKQRNLVFTQ